MIEPLVPVAERLKQAREALLAQARRVTEAEWNRPRSTDFSAREILTHLAGAERGMTRLAQRMAAGENPRLAPTYNNDFYNARQLEKRQGQSPAQLQAELAESRRDLLAFMETLTEADLRKRGEHPVVGDTDVLGLLNVIATHEFDHGKELGEWIDRLQGEGRS